MGGEAELSIMQLSLAGWSLWKLFRAESNPLKVTDFPRFAKENFGIEAVELNSPFFESREPAYLKQLVGAAEQAGVKLLNIAVDEQGDLSSEDPAKRELGLRSYGQWIPVAAAIGCTAIRANSGGREVVDREQAIANCIESFRRLADEGRRNGVTVLMENHGGISADADTIVRIMEALRQTHSGDEVGTLPDFGNWPDTADRYGSIEKIMPYAHAVHAKVNDIDENLNHPRFDHARCIAIAKAARYDGYLGIEYEGKTCDQVEGVKRGAALLRKLI